MTTQTYTSTNGLTFTIRTLSAGNGYMWTVIAQDHPYRKSSARMWANERLAVAAATRHIERTF